MNTGNESTDQAQLSPVVRSGLQPSVLIGLTVAFIGIGVCLSWIEFLDRNWLARAGALIVALGIWSGLGGLIQERFLIETHRLRTGVLMARAGTRRYANAEARKKALEELGTSLQNRLERHRIFHRLSVGVLEAVLLISGTLLWGFGDLLGYAF